MTLLELFKYIFYVLIAMGVPLLIFYIYIFVMIALYGV